MQQKTLKPHPQVSCSRCSSCATEATSGFRRINFSLTNHHTEYFHINVAWLVTHLISQWLRQN